MVGALLLPTPDLLVTAGGTVQLITQGKASLAALLMAVILWATEALAIAVTGLLALGPLVVTGVEGFGRLVAIPAGISASLSFIPVTSVPATVIPYATGRFSIMDMVEANIMTVASSACVTVSVCVLGSLTGLVSYYRRDCRPPPEASRLRPGW
jgi:solute carrier family 13 (sodium-dependent dicarboxylate transporter), member 2/3/5